MTEILSSNNKINYILNSNSSKKAIFIFHGYGASMNDLSGLAPYLDPDKKYDWYFPNGHLGVDIGMHMQGRAWFPINMEDLQKAMMQGGHRTFADKNPEGLELALKISYEFIDEFSKKYDEIIIGGFSQGSMVTSHLLNRFNNLKGFICLSGTLLASDKLEESLKKSNPISFFQSHGKDDPVLEYKQAMDLFEFLKLMRLQGEFVSFDGGHEIPLNVIEKCKKYIYATFEK